MPIPTVAIVGRPNVGKSSLLNVLAGRRISIVEDTPGVTRDRISALIELNGQYFELVDTGGYGIEDHDNLTEHVENQIQMALNRADLVLFVVDIRDGIVALDQKVAQLLRKQNLNVLLVANKADSHTLDGQAGEFFKLGFDKPLCVSAQHGRNRQLLVEYILKRLEGLDTTRPEDEVMKLAVVGKRNAGKSTFINSLAGEQRVIVSEVPGTTRDSVDVAFEMGGRKFVAIDTAGVRKKNKMNDQNGIEFYSYTRALESIRRADVVLFFIDATLPLSQVDKKLARIVSDEYKPCIVVFNKWDLAKDHADTDDYVEYMNKVMTGMSYAPICFVTASEGKNLQSLVDLATNLFKQSRTKVATGKLNKVIKAITDERAPSIRKKVGFPRIYYATQIAVAPPTILLFVNKPQALDENYRRFLLNRFRDELPFAEVPIRLMLRHHREQHEPIEA